MDRQLTLLPRNSYDPDKNTGFMRSLPRLSRRSQNILILILTLLLVWEHFFSSPSEPLRLDASCALPPSSGGSWFPSRKPDQYKPLPKSQVLSTGALGEKWTQVLELHQNAMTNVSTNLKDLAHYADRVKALIELQRLQDQVDSLDIGGLRGLRGEEAESWGERKQTVRVLQEELFDKLFPFVHRSPTQRRTMKDLLGMYTRPRGIIIPTGNEQFQMAVHLVSTLKHVHKTTLPIQIVYSGQADLIPQKRAALASIHPDVEIVDLVNIFDESLVGLINGGWAIKTFAILASPFKEVIICDADAIFFQPPEVLFDFPIYRETGTIYFRDREIFAGDGDVHRWWHGVMETRNASEEMLKSRFYTEKASREEMESGVVVYDKRKRDVMMGLLMVGWMNTRPVRDAITYQITYGDKESYWMGFELVNIPYRFSSVEYAPMIGQLTYPDGQAHSVNTQICSDHMLHLDTLDRPLWFNGGLFQEKGKKYKGFFFATHWVKGTGDWWCDPQPWCMRSFLETDVHKISDDGLENVLNHMIGTSAFWESQFPSLIERHHIGPAA